MSSEEFIDLALRVTEGSATPAERARFDAALAEQPERRAEWLALRRELQAAHDATADAADLAGPTETIPLGQQARLLGSSSASPIRPRSTRWLAWSAAAAAGLAAVFWFSAQKTLPVPGPAGDTPRLAFLVPQGGPITLTAGGRTWKSDLPVALSGGEIASIPEGHPALLLTPDGAVKTVSGRYAAASLPSARTDATLRWFTLPLAQLSTLPALTRGSTEIRILSPQGATTLAAPPLVWLAEPGRTYAVELKNSLQPSAPAARAENVVPPLTLRQLGAAPLQPEGIYELTIMETGRPATAPRARFMVVPALPRPSASTGPAADLAAAFQALAASPARTGDARLLLQALPPEWRDSELGRRLSSALNAP
jgi:hypothetical protein